MGLKTIDIPILRHQPKEEQHKCLSPTIFGYQILLCSRCFGLYVGLLLTMLFFWTTAIKIPANQELILLIAFPSIAFVDWIATKIFQYSSSNKKRVISGFCLGIAAAIIADHALKLQIALEHVIIPAIFAAIYLAVKKTLTRKEQ